MWAKDWRRQQAEHGGRPEEAFRLHQPVSGPTRLLRLRACCPKVQSEEGQAWRCQDPQPGVLSTALIRLCFPCTGAVCPEPDPAAARERASREPAGTLHHGGPHQALQLWGSQCCHLQPRHIPGEAPLLSVDSFQVPSSDGQAHMNL